jgi:dGTP triphosphohydrolase
MPFLLPERQERAKGIFNHITDTNEQLSYLRSTVIGTLINHCALTFVAHEKEILAGTFKGSLIDNLPPYLIDAYRNCSDFSLSHIYRSQEVLDVELPGHKIITELLDEFTTAVNSNQKAYSKQLLQRIPKQYNTQADSLYERLQAVIDYVSSMTDIYALELYKLINGMSLVRI